MPIQTVNGNDYYNYPIKDARIVEQDSYRTFSSANPSLGIRDYSVISQRKKLTKCKRFKRFLYNKENKTSCNRSGKHWGALIFYFVFFLGILFILFFCYFYGINRSMKSSPDKLLPAEKKFYVSAIPTFTFVPLTVNDYSQPCIWYKMHGVDSTSNRRAAPYVNAIEQFYKAQATLCAKQNKKKCAVDPSYYGPCGKDTFGYKDMHPCLFLKLNTRTDWRPDAYHSMHKVPKSMPMELKKILDVSRETLCVYCSGVTAFDEEKMGKVTYYPEQCYNDSAFPFSKDPVDVNPTIAIQLKQIQPGFVVELTCRLFGVGADGTEEYQQNVFIYIGSK